MKVVCGSVQSFHRVSVQLMNGMHTATCKLNTPAANSKWLGLNDLP